MAFTLALIGSLLWAGIFFALFYMRQTPESKVRKRILTMMETAEKERERAGSAKNTKKVKVHDPKEKKSFYFRIIKPKVESAVDFFHSFTPTAIVAMLENRIFRAGKQNIWSVQRVAAFWAISVAFFTGVGFFVAQRTNYFVTQQFLIMVAGGVFGAFFPFILLNQKIAARQKLLKRQLPEFLDLLCVSVQAGLSFDASVAKITVRMKGELSEEFKHMQEDVRFGMTKQYALAQMAKRCDVEEIYLFTTSVIQAEKLGTSMAQTLATQAENMRERRRQYIRAEALKAPVKMIFPMVMFIFPSIFIVLLMPSIMTMMKSFGAMN